MKQMLSGNEGIARGAYEAGVTVATGYPGTPSTEIMESLLQFKNIAIEWCPNEKVALEVGSGASLAGARALVVMKHVGVNVAADPLLTLPYIGVNGGLVLITADDPNMYSSQNEQDNRNYARFAKVPMLEPSDSQEAKDFVKIAFKLSERFDTLTMLRTTTRISHSGTIVKMGRPQKPCKPSGPVKNPQKYVMVPVNARERHRLVEKRMKELTAFAEKFPINRIEWGKKDIGIITSGACYHYSREVFPEASYLKLGMVYPLPVEMIKQFASKVKKVYVVEELDAFLEEQIKGLGIDVTGKEILPVLGEFDPGVVEEGIKPKRIKNRKPAQPTESIPARPPNLCPGCPHRGIFYIFNKLKVFVAGDIGCYTLAYMPPLSSLDTCVCMGAGIGQAHGIEQAIHDDALGKVVAVIGDSTFFHSGITSLLNTSYNKSKSTIIILDNRFTAMTGGQEHPGTGFTMRGEETHMVDYYQLCQALGIKNVRKVDPYAIEETLKIIKEEVNRPELSVIISEAPCILNRKEFSPFPSRYEILEEECTGCKKCLKVGCPAIGWEKLTPPAKNGKGNDKKKRPPGLAVIDPLLCFGCSICSQVCDAGAIKESRTG
ncbi:MAG: indolepyruvate ferredoxin oxidoreductase subunit alpha [Proteobacteria bacterium]|nr:indolepyruvate ferredoxin oxidoreductase subunit alpha [Pseudomonadota bacterium]